jgi:hypothetical protein
LFFGKRERDVVIKGEINVISSSSSSGSSYRHSSVGKKLKVDTSGWSKSRMEQEYIAHSDATAAEASEVVEEVLSACPEEQCDNSTPTPTNNDALLGNQEEEEANRNFLSAPPTSSFPSILDEIKHILDGWLIPEDEDDAFMVDDGAAQSEEEEEEDEIQEEDGDSPVMI